MVLQGTHWFRGKPKTRNEIASARNREKLAA
jgi:hypothetical protein